MGKLEQHGEASVDWEEETGGRETSEEAGSGEEVTKNHERTARPGK